MAITAEFLKQVYLFESLPAADLEWLIVVAKSRTLLAGETLFTAGAAADALFVIQQGTVEIYSKGQQEARAVAMLGSGAILGEMAFASPKPRSASAEAKENTQLLEISYTALEKHAQSDPRFGMTIYRALARQLSQRINQTTHDLATLKEIKLRAD